MSNNTVLNPGASGDTIRSIDKGAGVKTQSVVLDLGGTPSTVYLLECVATTSDGLKPYLTSYLTVR